MLKVIKQPTVAANVAMTAPSRAPKLIPATNAAICLGKPRLVARDKQANNITPLIIFAGLSCASVGQVTLSSSNMRYWLKSISLLMKEGGNQYINTANRLNITKVSRVINWFAGKYFFSVDNVATLFG